MYVIDPTTGVLTPPNGTNGTTHSLNGVLDTLGRFVPLDSLAQTINRDPGTGSITSIVATGFGGTWTQTFTYENGQAKTISGWVKSA